MINKTRYVNRKYPVGVSEIRMAILDCMQNLLPQIHDGLRDQQGLTDDDFPIFTRIDRTGPPRGGMGGNEYALLVLAVMSTQNMGTTDIDDLGSPEQLIEYRTRLYSFVKANKETESPTEPAFGYQRVEVLRGLTEASVRAVLLGTPSMQTTNGFVKPDSISAQYSDIQAVKGDRWVAAVYHEFIFRNQETVVSPQLGTADTIQVSTALLSRS